MSILVPMIVGGGVGGLRRRGTCSVLLLVLLAPLLAAQNGETDFWEMSAREAGATLHTTAVPHRLLSRPVHSPGAIACGGAT